MRWIIVKMFFTSGSCSVAKTFNRSKSSKNFIISDTATTIYIYPYRLLDQLQPVFVSGLALFGIIILLIIEPLLI